MGSGDLLDGMGVYPAVLINQQPKGLFLEMCCGCQPETLFNVHNAVDGSQILQAREHSNWCARNFCGTSRPFEMTISTLDGNEIIRYERPFHPARRGGFFCCCCAFCFQVIRVYSGSATANPGKLLGWVREDYDIRPAFSVFDANDNLRYKIQGDCCGCWTYTMRIHPPDNYDTQIGSIQKRWPGLVKELLNLDNFVAEFPGDSTPADRALIMGATILLDYLYFEKTASQEQQTI